MIFLPKEECEVSALEGSNTFILESTWTEKVICIDGKKGSAEWGEASKIKINSCYLTLQNDETCLYILLEALPNTTFDLLDVIFITFYVDSEDLCLTLVGYPNSDHLFLAQDLESSTFDGLRKTTFPIKKGISDAKEGKTFRYLIWESAVDLNFLKLKFGQQIRFGIGLTSRKPLILEEFPLGHLDDTSKLATLRLAQPPTLKTIKIDNEDITNFLEPLIGMDQIRILITKGPNKSYIKFGKKLNMFGAKDIYFTIEPYKKGFWPFRIVEYPNLIASKKLKFIIGKNCLILTMTFEEEDEEIKGTWNGQMSNMKVSIYLYPEVNNYSLSYSKVKTIFDFDINFKGIHNILLKKLFKVRKRFKSAVEKNLTEVFQDLQFKQAFSDSIMKGLTLIDLPKIVWVKVEDGKLLLSGYK
jgi:hypothetical protein